MGEKNTQELNKEIINKIRIASMKWTQADMPLLTKDEFIEYCKERAYVNYFDELTRYWTIKHIFTKKQLEEYYDILDEIKPSAPSIIWCIIDLGLYKDLSYIDKAFDLLTFSYKLKVLNLCSFEKALKIAQEDSETKVRYQAIKRLGPAHALDIALSDSRREVRELGVIWAPKNYNKLRELRDDISFVVMKHLIKKIPIDEVPFMLANRNFQKLKNMSTIAEARMNREGYNV